MQSSKHIAFTATNISAHEYVCWATLHLLYALGKDQSWLQMFLFVGVQQCDSIWNPDVLNQIPVLLAIK